MGEAAKQTKKPSSWSKLPGAKPSDGDNGNNGQDRSLELLDAAREELGDLTSKLDRSVRRASKALAGPSHAGLHKLYASADLPDVDADDALQTLASRIDRESDLWRGLSLRALTRAVWADRFTQAFAVITATGCLGLATVAALGGLFGMSEPWSRIAMVLAGAVVLVAGALVVSWTSAAVRRAQRSIAQAAQARADLAELRLHRLALVLAMRGTDDEMFREALVRLERDASAPPG